MNPVVFSLSIMDQLSFLLTSTMVIVFGLDFAKRADFQRLQDVTFQMKIHRIMTFIFFHEPSQVQVIFADRPNLASNHKRNLVFWRKASIYYTGKNSSVAYVKINLSPYCKEFGHFLFKLHLLGSLLVMRDLKGLIIIASEFGCFKVYKQRWTFNKTLSLTLDVLPTPWKMLSS